MNIGELDDRVSILTVKQSENICKWEQTCNIWAKTERLNGSNIFSKVGLGARSIKFTIRKNGMLTLHNALRWQGKHCFITDIMDNRMYQEITAAIIEPRICFVKRTTEPVLNELNRPVYGEPTVIIFPGCLTEKYLGYTQEKPMAITETRFVLVTPKPVELEAGEIVTIDNTSYTVMIPHFLDDFKNEYEIMAKGDV